jgi:hypothetical protein
MAYVKLSSRYLSSITPKSAETQLREILSELGVLTDYAHVSRIDLCADFVSYENMETWGREAWITRAKKIDAHAVSEKFTGWSIGLGGKISFVACITNYWKSKAAVELIFFHCGKLSEEKKVNQSGALSFSLCVKCWDSMA